MDQHSLDNWVKIKETFEESGNTDPDSQIFIWHP
jgi:hypothetical protein